MGGGAPDGVASLTEGNLRLLIDECLSPEFAEKFAKKISRGRLAGGQPVVGRPWSSGRRNASHPIASSAEPSMISEFPQSSAKRFGPVAGRAGKTAGCRNGS